MVDHQMFMEYALKEAKRALIEDEVPVGCVIVKDNQIIASAYNQKESLQQPIAHAEILAILEAVKTLKSWRLDDCTLYVTLEPCPMCAGAIMQARVKEVIFAAYDPKGGSYGTTFNLNEVKGLNHYPVVTGGVCEAKSAILLKDFFKNKRIEKTKPKIDSQ